MDMKAFMELELETIRIRTQLESTQEAGLIHKKVMENNSQRGES